MEDVRAADVSYLPRAREQGPLLHASPSGTATAAAAAASQGVPQGWAGSPQDHARQEGQQTHCMSAALLQGHHHHLQQQQQENSPELRQDQQQRNREPLLLSHAPQRRHSASEYFAQQQLLSSFSSEELQQRQHYQQKRSEQLNSTQQQELQHSYAPARQPVLQRCRPPLLPQRPQRRHLSESARLHACTAGQSAWFLLSNSSPHTAMPNLRQHSSRETGRIPSCGSSRSSSSYGIRGDISNSNSSLSTCNTSVCVSRSTPGISCGSPGLDEIPSSSDKCIKRQIRTSSSCSSKPFLDMSARVDTLQSWSSEILFPPQAALSHQTDEEGAHETATAESAAAAAARSAARAAAASAAARREAQAAATTARTRRGSPTARRKSVAGIIDAANGFTTACARVISLSRAATTDEAVEAFPATYTRQTGELLRGSTGNSEYSNTSWGAPLPPTRAASEEPMWKLGENIWAAAIVRNSSTLALVKDEATAVLTLSPELEQVIDGAATPAAAEGCTALEVASGIAAFSPPEESAVSDDTAADVRGHDASSAGAAAVIATARSPQLASLLHRSPGEAPAADSSALQRAAPAAATSAPAAARPAAAATSAPADSTSAPAAAAETSAAAGAATSAAAPFVCSYRLSDTSAEGAASATADALESPFIQTREGNEHAASTPKSSCIRASPKSCYTSHSADEAQQQQLLLQEDQEPSLEEQQWKDDLLLARELDNLTAEENLLQQPLPQQQQHAHHWQQGDLSPQMMQQENTQDKQEPSQQQQLQHDQPHIQQHQKPHQKQHEQPHQQRHEQPHRQQESQLQELSQQQQYELQQRELHGEQQELNELHWRLPQSQSEQEIFQAVQEQQSHLSQQVPLSVPSRCAAGAADVEVPSSVGFFCVDKQRSLSVQESQQLDVLMLEKQHPQTNQQHVLTYQQQDIEPITLQHRKRRTITHEHLQRIDAPEQPLQPAEVEQQPAGPEVLSSQQTAQERHCGQHEPICTEPEAEGEEEGEEECSLEPQEKLRSQQQSLERQERLAREKEDEQRLATEPCSHESEGSSREQAAAVRELQHLVQQQQAQLQQLVQQQTMLLQQLLHSRHSSADLPAAAQYSVEESEASKPVHLTAVIPRNAAAAPPATAESIARPTLGMTTTSAPSCATSAPQAAAQVSSAEVADAPTAGLMAVATSFAAAAEPDHSKTASVERSYCCTEEFQADQRVVAPNAGCFKQTKQRQLQSQAEKSSAEETPEQNTKRDTHTSLLQLQHEDPHKQQAHALFYSRKLLQVGQQLQESHQDHFNAQEEHQIKQTTMVQVWPQVEEKEQQLFCEENLDEPLKHTISCDNKEKEGYCSSMLLHQSLHPPPALLSTQLQVPFDGSSATQQKTHNARTALMRRSSPAANTGGHAPAAAAAASPAVHEATKSESAEASAAEAAAREPLVRAQAAGTYPATAAAAEREERTPVQTASTPVKRHHQHWNANLSSLPLQQQQGRGKHIAATTVRHLASSRSSNISETLMNDTSFSRLSTNTGSRQQIQHYRESRMSPRLLPRHSLQSLHCSPGPGDDARRSLATRDEGAFAKPAAAAPSFLAAADERAQQERQQQQQPMCAPEVLRQEQRELQRKLQLLQEQMQQLQQEQKQRKHLQNQHATLDVCSVPSHQRRSIETDSPLDEQLPLLLHNLSLQRVTQQQQQCQQMQQKQKQDGSRHYEEYARPKTSTIVKQRYNRTNNRSSSSGGSSTVLTNSRDRSSSRDIQLQPSGSSGGRSTRAAESLHPSLKINALYDNKCCLVSPASPGIQQERPLLLEEAAAAAVSNAMSQAATAGPPPTEKTRKKQAEEYSAQASAQAAQAVRAAAAAFKGTLPDSGDVYGLLSNRGESKFHLLPYDYLQAAEVGSFRTVAAAESALFVSAASAPAVSLSAKADPTGLRYCSATQRQSDAAGRTPSLEAYYSSSDISKKNGSLPVDQVYYSPFAARAAAGTVKGCTQYQQLQHIQYKGGNLPVQAAEAARTSAGSERGELSGCVPRCVPQSRLRRQISVQEPPFVLPGLQNTLQQQDALPEISDDGHPGPHPVTTPQQGPPRILDQDEQIVPSVLKRLLLQQQQHHETCWWEEAASSRTPVKKQQQHHQRQLCRRVSASEQHHQKQNSKRLTRTRPGGAPLSVAKTNMRPSAIHCSEKDAAVRTPASRQQQSSQQRDENRKTFLPCCSATQASTSSSGKHLNSTISNRNIDSKQNSGRNRKSGNSLLRSVQGSAGRVTGTPRSPRSTTKTTQHDGCSRARVLQQKHCSRRHDSTHQTPASPEAPLAADLIQPGQKGAVNHCIPLGGGDAAATIICPTTGSVLLTSSGADVKGHLGSSSVSLAPVHSRCSTAHPISSVEASKPSFPCKTVDEEDLSEQSSTHITSHGGGKPEKCCVMFTEATDGEGDKCSLYMQQQESRALFEEDQTVHISRVEEHKQHQRGDNRTVSSAALHHRHGPVEERVVRTVNNPSVKSIDEEAHAQVLQSRVCCFHSQQERQRLQQTERLNQVSQQQPVRRTQETTQEQPRQVLQEKQSRALDVEEDRVPREDGSELHLRGEIGVSAASRSRLTRFLEVPEHSRPARGQETAALVRLFLSQQEQLSAATVAGSGCRWKRNTGNGVPFLDNHSVFCVEHLKHLREDSAGDAYYVKTMAKLLQRYDQLTTVD